MPQIFFLEEITNESVNPYEAVTIASQEARRINQVRLMMDVTEEGEKPTTLALKRLAEKKVVLAYDSEESEGDGEDAGAKSGADATGQAEDSAGS